jgi:MYXO-CTERM domain-containing protein
VAGELRQGTNHNSPDRTYSVVDWDVHPEYGASTAYDLAMVTFSGADAATPIMPAASLGQDNYTAGQTITATGYGLDPGSNADRKSVALTIDFATETLIGFDQTSSGVCSGDSGGAANDGSLVFGVHSFITDASCTGPNVQGVAVRVAPNLDTFINPYINGTPYQSQTCDQCSDAHRQLGECSDEVSACLNSGACSDYIDCLNACTTIACQVQCDLDNAQGKAVYDGIGSCVCDDACATECAGDNACAEPPECYLGSSDVDCQTCFEASCCVEMTDCAADGLCRDCLTSPIPPVGCGNNAAFNALDACLSDNCGTECPDAGMGGFGGGVGTGGAGGGMVGVGGGSVGVGGATAGAGGSSSSGNMVDEDDDLEVQQSGCACSTERRGGDVSWLLALVGLVVFRRRTRG